ncbi:MAG: DNA helicase RecQ [Gammaproteobacteria bacterium]
MLQHATEILKTTFGFQEFRPSQEKIIDELLRGQDCLVLMPTGGGKSLCYQIPALVREGTGIIVSPLIALMQDQVDALKQLGVKAAFLNSSLEYKEASRVEGELINGTLDILYVAPERLLTERMMRILDNARLSLFAIDEAHCVSQWGHDFRPEYQRLKSIHTRYPDVPRIALTATADQRTREEIISQLQLEQANVFIDSFDRPNIHYAISDGANSKQRLWTFISQHHAEDAGIVYCLSRKKVDAVAEWLSDQGRVALPYHAGLAAEVRQEHQRRFLREEGVIIVATIAFGMGIDKPDVRFVAHLNLPKSIEAYYQETGRAGRDGLPANAWMAFGLQDVITLRQFSQNSNANETHKRVEHHKLEAMLGLCELVSCRRHALLEYFDEDTKAACGNCDNCLRPPQKWDASQASQMALSCVYRTEQRFGVNYIVDILLGKEDDRIQRNGHDQLSTYGIGKEFSTAEWRVMMRQLIALGFLEIDIERHGALRLTEKCRPVLRGEETLQLRKMEKQEKQVSSSKKGKQTVRPQDEALWEALRALRLSLAEKAGVPPYVIFHDATLQEMLKERPLTLDAMSNITGVGEQKLNRFGKQFINEIEKYPLTELLDNTLSKTVNETLMLYQQGKTIEQIIKDRELTSTTVYTHLSSAIEMGLLDVKEVLELDEQKYDEIVLAIESFGDDEERRLKPVFEALDGAYDYGFLRCVQASI